MSAIDRHTANLLRLAAYHAGHAGIHVGGAVAKSDDSRENGEDLETGFHDDVVSEDWGLAIHVPGARRSVLPDVKSLE